MLELLKELIKFKPGTFGFSFALTLIGGWLIFFATKNISEIKADNSVLKNSVAKIEEKIEKIESDIVGLKTDFAFVKAILEYQFASKDASTQKKSPLALTESGEKIVKTYNLKEIVDENWTKINDHLKSTNLIHPFDIERFCIERTFVTPEKFFSDNDIEKLNTIVYKNGYHFMQISRIMAVLIIERYFAENNIETNL